MSKALENTNVYKNCLGSKGLNKLSCPPAPSAFVHRSSLALLNLPCNSPE
jgi:hypothetical protein